jgi:hypothetical protein
MTLWGVQPTILQGYHAVVATGVQHARHVSWFMGAWVATLICKWLSGELHQKL